MRVAAKVELDDRARKALLKLSRSKKTSVRLAQRASIVLLAEDGLQNQEIASLLGIGRVPVSRWRERSIAQGLAGTVVPMRRCWGWCRGMTAAATG